MRVCTLIVRLVGLALLLYSAIIVVELQLLTKQANVALRPFSAAGSPHGEMANAVQRGWQRIFWYGVAGMAIGGVMAIAAPAVARILTYDAPEERAA